MGILINKKTRVIVQGISGKAGHFHAQDCRQYGTLVVGGVTPGRGGEEVEEFPVYDTVLDAKTALHPDATLILVPAPSAADAILEAEDAGIPLIVCVTEGIPTRDMLEVKRVMAHSKKSRLIGPNSPGVITPHESKVGIMPGKIFKKGMVGIVSRAGTLMYEAAWQTTRLGLGQSTCVGIGGDPLCGSGFVEILQLFEEDPQTEAMLLIGEIGGEAEECAAAWYRKYGKKPLSVFVAGMAAPDEKQMGHAGAIITMGRGKAVHKLEAFRESGAAVVCSPSEMGVMIQRSLGIKPNA